LRPVIKLIWLIALLLVGRFALAQPLTIDITKGIEGSGIPITIASFGGGAPEDIAGIVASDLQRTGKIAPQPAGSRADYSVTGQAQPGGSRGYVVQFQLAGAQGSPLLNGWVGSCSPLMRRT